VSVLETVSIWVGSDGLVGIDGVSRWQWVVVNNGLSVVGGGNGDGNWDTSVLVFGMLDGHFGLDGPGHFGRCVAHFREERSSESEAQR